MTKTQRALTKAMAGGSLRALAKEMGISAPYLSDILKGKRLGDGPKVQKYLRGLCR